MGKGAVSFGPLSGKQIVVVSRTLKAEEHPSITIFNNPIVEQVTVLKVNTELLDEQLVDTLELAIMPILLSQGIPILPAGKRSSLPCPERSKHLPNGIVVLTYLGN